MQNFSEIPIRPIGQIESPIKEKMRHGWGQVESAIIIDPDLAKSLDGLEEFSHIIVLFWMHKSIGEVPAKVHPQGRSELPLTGIFATRSPHRPNSIGLTIVKLLERKGNILRVRGLDAIDGTPVLDIKPHLPKDDISGAHYPDWVSKLDHSQKMSTDLCLQQIYHRLFELYGPQHWWPADESFEVIVGAILTQSTAWLNVEKAIVNLKEAGVLNPVSLHQIPTEELAQLIRPSGYYNVKAHKLKAFVKRLEEYNYSLDRMFTPNIPQLRTELLSIYGIGQETADSIILYAAEKPIFVIDAYTHRIMDRLGLNSDYGNYTALQDVFMSNLTHDEKLFNEYHALFVRHGKEVCRKSSPLCHDCCLSKECQSPNSSI